MEISNVQDLETAIQELEVKQLQQKKAMTTEFKNTVESLKPMNIIKSSFRQINSNQVARTVLKTAGGLGIGLLTNKLAGVTLGASRPKSVVGSLIKSSVSAALLGNADKIKAYGTAIFKNLFGNKKNTLR